MNGNNALAESAPRVIVIDAKEQPENIKLRVAAYTRVSSSSDEQLNSFAAQNRYYTTLISGKENWELVDVYADEGITGTSAEKREDFQRLMADCRRGKIDRVLVKSISRFARNTKECLEAIRELKAMGIGVVFEKESIDTSKISGEMLTSMFASMAQAESESISTNMRWSYQSRMARGKFNTQSAAYGFQLDSGQLLLKENIKFAQGVFFDYLNGKTKKDILNRLQAMESSGKKWTLTTIEYILRNERYAGNALLQKKYTTDTLPRQRKRNKGERAMYFVQGSNPAAISQEMFDKSEALRKSRCRPAMSIRWGRALSQKVVCGCCGASFRYKLVRENLYMVCRNHEYDKESCQLAPIQEQALFDAFLCMYHKLKHQGQLILKQMLSSLQSIRRHRMLWSLDIVELNKQIAKLSSQNQKLAEFQKLGLIDSDIFYCPKQFIGRADPQCQAAQGAFAG